MQEVTYEQIRARASLDINEMSVSDAEWAIRINDAAKDYWNRINMSNQMYNVTKYSFLLQSGVAEYSFPEDFLYVVAADIDKTGSDSENSTNRISVVFYPLEYRNAYRTGLYPGSGTIQSSGPYSAIILSTSSFQIQPNPVNSNYLFILRYVPVTPTLSNDGVTMNGINGFDVYISQLAAKRILDSRGQTSIALTQDVLSFQEYLKSPVVTRNRAMRTPVIDRAIGPYASYTGFGSG